jgi:SAM-dependent methyltransferase
MIICAACGARKSYALSECFKCGFEPKQIDGFLAWAPDLAKHNDGFSEKSFEGLAQLEADNFWFRSRNKIIVWALRKYFSDFECLLEVGCGTGFVLQAISHEFPNALIVGSEIYTTGLKFAAKRLPFVELIQMDARKIPFEAEFDLVVAFDVIEHILEDELVLQNFHRAIKPGGGCLISVPQHKWLWSPEDDVACHKRRYSISELHAKVKAAGFSIQHSTSFVSLLLPLMLASRLMARISGRADSKQMLALNPTVDKVLEFIMRFEYFLIRLGVTLPIGGSRLVVLHRKHF